MSSSSTMVVGAFMGTLLTTAFVAIVEEVVLRGAGMQVLARNPKMTILGAFVMQGVVFGLLHALNPGATWYTIANTVIWGLVFGSMALSTGSLDLAIGAHFGWNLMLPVFSNQVSGYAKENVALFIVKPGDSVWITGGIYGVEGSLFTSITGLVLIGMFLRLAKKKEGF